MVFATRMNGPLIARFDNALNGSRVRNNLYSEEAQWVPQYVLEDVLRNARNRFPMSQFFSRRVCGADTDSKWRGDPGARCARDNRTATMQSRYLIGADGARSSVRDAIGATMIGEGAFSRNFSIIFRAAAGSGARKMMLKFRENAPAYHCCADCLTIRTPSAPIR